MSLDEPNWKCNMNSLRIQKMFIGDPNKKYNLKYLKIKKKISSMTLIKTLI